MGQICSFCRYICGCLPGDEHEVVDDMEPTDYQLPPQQYQVPSAEFPDVPDVLRARGYDHNSQKHLGKGGSGVVCRVTRMSDRKDVAMKLLQMYKKDRDKDESLAILLNEIEIISRLKHKNITRLLDCFYVNTVCYLVIEFANSGTVQDLLDKSGPMDEPTAKKFFRQMVSGIKYMLSLCPPIAHSDLKLENILIDITDNESVVKITDFGLSRIVDTRKEDSQKQIRTKDPAGSLPYMSPERLKLYLYHNMDSRKRLKADPNLKPKTVNLIKSDIWSLGVCLYRMLTNRYPYKITDNTTGHILEIVKLMFDKKMEPIGVEISPELTFLLDDMLEPFTKDRTDIKRVEKHRWLRNG